MQINRCTFETIANKQEEESWHSLSFTSHKTQEAWIWIWAWTSHMAISKIIARRGNCLQLIWECVYLYIVAKYKNLTLHSNNTFLKRIQVTKQLQELS